MLELKQTTTWILALISAAIWNFIWIHTGYTLGNNWGVVQDKIHNLVKQYNLIAGITITLFIIIFVAYKIHCYHKENKQK
jgi:membrane protein DedA with SNARE-associated domain